MDAMMARGSGNLNDRPAAMGAAPIATLTSALNIVTDIGERAHDLAERAESLANRLSGVAPSAEVSGKAPRDADNITDALNDRARAIHDPMHRLQSALDRISQRLA